MYDYIGPDGSTTPHPDADSAMRQYAAAGFTGRIAPHGDPPEETKEERAIRLLKIGEADSSFDAPTVDERDRKAAEADADRLKAMGIVPGRTVFSPGTPLNMYGIDTWRRERQAAEEMPPIGPQCDEIIRRVHDEHRKDFNAEVSDLRMRVDNGLLRLYRQSVGKEGVTIEQKGIEALANRTDRRILPNVGFLRTMVADEIAELWNSRAARLGEKDTIRLRLRNGTGVWSTYAVVSPKYGAFDVDKMCAELKAAAGDMPGSVVYNTNEVSLDVEGVSVKDTPPVVGEVWKAAFRGTTADDGTSALDFGGGFWRAVCRNLTSECLGITTYRRVHRGTMTSVADRIRGAIASAESAFGVFADRWGALKRTPATSIFGGVDIEEAVKNLVDKKHLAESVAIKRDTMVELILSGIRKEQDQDSLAAIVNAITRFHTERVAVPVLRRAEELAGSLVMELSDNLL